MSIKQLKKEVQDISRELYGYELYGDELKMAVKMRKMLVAIDNLEVSYGTGSTSDYKFQDKLIKIARKANGQYGI